MGKNFLSIIIVVLFSVIAGFALLHPGLPPTHDGEYHVIRFFLFNEALTDGNLYPRWASHLNNDFGVPLFNFVYPLPNYISSLFHLINISFIDAFKLNMFMATIVGGIFFYLWSKEFWGKLGGIVSSVFYTFSPYHFVDIYIRGSVGEVWALGLFPGFLWAYTRFVKSERKIYLALSSIFLALIIFSHNILAIMFFAFSIFYVLFLIIKEKNKKYLIFNSLFIILFGLGLSAIFWLPAIAETKYVTGLQIFDVTAHFPELFQLLIPSWGSGFSGAGMQNELSYQIGAANLLVIFLSVIVILLQIKRKNKNLPYLIFFFVSFVFTFYLMLNISSPIWQIIPFMNYFQFPWRLLSIEILFASFLAGSIFSLGMRNNLLKIIITAVLIFVTVIFGIGYAKPAYYMYRDDSYYITRSNFIDGTNSPGNVFNTIYLKSIPEKEKQKAIITKGAGKIFINSARSNYYSFKMMAESDSEVQVNLAYFPGWEVYVNGRKVPTNIAQNGGIVFNISKGVNNVEAIFGDTFVRKLSVFISLTSVFFMLTTLIGNRFAIIKK